MFETNFLTSEAANSKEKVGKLNQNWRMKNRVIRMECRKDTSIYNCASSSLKNYFKGPLFCIRECNARERKKDK